MPTAAPSDGSFAADRIDVVRNGSFGIEVDDVDASIAALTATIEGKGGYLAGSYRYADGTNPAVTVTFRLPASSFDATVLAVRAEGRVLSEQISTYEVTMQLVDLEARLRNLPRVAINAPETRFPSRPPGASRCTAGPSSTP